MICVIYEDYSLTQKKDRAEVFSIQKDILNKLEEVRRGISAMESLETQAKKYEHFKFKFSSLKVPKYKYKYLKKSSIVAKRI